MRAYYFGNMYLSSIQQGIQAAHVTADMFVKYNFDDLEYIQLSDWATDHKTMILLNAGYGEQIRALGDRFNHVDNPYPWADFHEEEASLDGAITCIGIILPEKIYESSAYLRSLSFRKREEEIEHTTTTGVLHRSGQDGNKIATFLSKWELNLVLDLNNYGMAR